MNENRRYAQATARRTKHAMRTGNLERAERLMRKHAALMEYIKHRDRQTAQALAVEIGLSLDLPK